MYIPEPYVFVLVSKPSRNMNRKFIAAVLGIRSLQHDIYKACQVTFIFEKGIVKQRKLVIRVHDYGIVGSRTTIYAKLGKVKLGLYSKRVSGAGVWSDVAAKV